MTESAVLEEAVGAKQRPLDCLGRCNSLRSCVEQRAETALRATIGKQSAGAAQRRLRCRASS